MDYSESDLEKIVGYRMRYYRGEITKIDFCSLLKTVGLSQADIEEQLVHLNIERES